MKRFSACVVLITVLIQLFTAKAQSPCPEIFEYANDDNGVYGIITLKPDGRKNTITIRTNFTITAQLNSDYVGNIKPYRGTNAILEYNRGKPINYRVNFPVSSPLPKITGIYVNDDLVCSDEPDTLETSDYVTTITLQHTLFMQTGSKVVPTTIKRPSRPVVIVSNTEDTTDRTIYQVTRPKPAVVPNRRWPPPSPEPEPEEQQYMPPARKPAPVVADDFQFSSNEGCGKAKKEVALIWHGHSYSPGEWPWLVAIYQTGARQLNFVCSGTLVSDRHVITAAHCMQNKEASDIVVKLGVYNLEEWGGDVVVKKLQSAIVHEQFNRTNLANDISLFTLEQSVQFNSNIKPICLWGTDANLNRIVGHTGVVTGWGDNEFGRGGHGDPRMIRLPIVSTEDCRASTPDLYKLTSDRTLCAGNRDGKGPCSGDSGGGLYVIDDGRWKLRGIVSLALSSKTAEMRCNLDEYVVFTDAAKYTRWIHKYMQF